MALSIRPLQPFCAEVSGADLREPLAPADIAAIHAGMNRHAVLIFHGQSLTPEQQRTMTMQFGPKKGQSVTVPAKRVVKFRVSKAAKDAILASK